jgi:phage gpG-like protein
MAGVKIEIEVQDAHVRAAFARLIDAGRDMSLPMADAGEYLLRSTRDRAALQVDPDGIAWAPLTPRYAKRKAKLKPGLPMLKFDYHMLGDRLAYFAGPDSLEVGTGAIYGARQQFGGGGILSRPWLGLSDQDDAELLEIFGAPFRNAISG